MNETGFYVAKLWHEILMSSSTEEYVKKYPELMDCSPLEIQIIVITGTSSNLLLRDYVSALHIPKSTLTSAVKRLEKQKYIKRTICEQDLRSYSLVLDEKGIVFLEKYLAYQNDMGNQIINGLDENEKKQLIALLKKIPSYMLGDNYYENTQK